MYVYVRQDYFCSASLFFIITIAAEKDDRWFVNGNSFGIAVLFMLVLPSSAPFLLELVWKF